MKKLINAPEAVLADALKGIEAAHADLRVDHVNRVIYRATPKDHGTVALVSGGGSGHEPLHGGFVGFGMLDAACAGEVFTSPTPDQMQAATKEVDRGAGVLHIVKNYTGDVMNFEMAAELAAMEASVDVKTIVVNDDVAVQDSLWTAGRRGVGLTVLLEKIVGAAAEQGRSLDDLVALSEKINGDGRSMGMALTSCTVPAAGKPTFDLPDDEMEIGVGIHGEPGRHRVPLADAHHIAEQLVEPIPGLILECGSSTDDRSMLHEERTPLRSEYCTSCTARLQRSCKEARCDDGAKKEEIYLADKEGLDHVLPP